MDSDELFVRRPDSRNQDDSLSSTIHCMCGRDACVCLGLLISNRWRKGGQNDFADDISPFVKSVRRTTTHAREREAPLAARFGGPCGGVSSTNWCDPQGLPRAAYGRV